MFTYVPRSEGLVPCCPSAAQVLSKSRLDGGGSACPRATCCSTLPPPGPATRIQRTQLSLPAWPSLGDFRPLQRVCLLLREPANPDTKHPSSMVTITWADTSQRGQCADRGSPCSPSPGPGAWPEFSAGSLQTDEEEMDSGTLFCLTEEGHLRITEKLGYGYLTCSGFGLWGWI